jgi:hypothetical protein
MMLDVYRKAHSPRNLPQRNQDCFYWRFLTLGSACNLWETCHEIEMGTLLPRLVARSSNAAGVPRIPPMQGDTLERWQRVCKEAAGEQDPHRFLELTRAILRMLTQKEQQLQQVRAKKKPSAASA